MLSGRGGHVLAAHREDRVDTVRPHVVLDDIPAEEGAVEGDAAFGMLVASSTQENPPGGCDVNSAVISLQTKER